MNKEKTGNQLIQISLTFKPMLKLETKKDVINLGIFLAILEALFCLMFGWILMSSTDLFASSQGSVLQIGLALLLVVIGVAGSGLIVFGYPVYFAFTGEKEKAIKLTISTVVTLIIIAIFLLLVAGIIYLTF